MSTVVQVSPSSNINLSNEKQDVRKDVSIHRRPSFHLIHKRHKDDFRKKRHHSGSGGGSAVKRRKKDVLIPPTKFLLGGNIRDPLNLNSLRDEEVNRRLNAVTPETSPMPTPQWKKGEVEVLLPPNIHDPLNLEGSESPESSSTNLYPKRNKKKHKKKKQHPKQTEDGQSEGQNEGVNTSGEISIDEGQSEATELPADLPSTSGRENVQNVEFAHPLPVEEKSVPVPPNSLPINKNLDPHIFSKKLKSSTKKEKVDKIVSPVVKQPGTTSSSTNSSRKKHQHLNNKNNKTPNFKQSNKRYQYGNYNRYYGYRNADHDLDPRLRLLDLRRDLFENKDILDIGCNTGHITLTIASEMLPKSVIGLDLDKKLVEAARSNIKHYIRRNRVGNTAVRESNSSQLYPISMSLLYGPLPDTRTQSNTAFPHNISFVQGNYVVSSDVLIELEEEKFDTILCLSVTKWFHLNFGDDGLKRAFKRMYAQLRPGGVLILEPQPWSSYKKKKNLTETTWRNFQAIQLFPAKFTQFLLTEVGFSKCEILGSPIHNSRGFQRPIKIFSKGNPRHPPTHSKSRQDSDSAKDSTKEAASSEIKQDNSSKKMEENSNLDFLKDDDCQSQETVLQSNRDLDSAVKESQESSSSPQLESSTLIKEPVEDSS